MPTYTGQKAFQWSDGSTANHGMMWSILPIAPGDATGLGNGKVIIWSVKNVPLGVNADSFAYPTVPSGVTPTSLNNGAMALLASGALAAAGYLF